MKIGIDLDDTITYAPAFFKELTNSLNAEIHIITARCGPEDHDFDEIEKRTRDDLRELGIRFDRLALVGPRNKASYIEDNQIQIMFDDTDEEIIKCPKSCIVFKIREEMNFCWDSMRWLHSNKTSVKI